MAYCPRCERPVDAARCPDCGGDTHERPRVRTAERDLPFLEADDPRQPASDDTVAPDHGGSAAAVTLRYPLAAGPRPLALTTALLALSVLVLPLVCLWGYWVHVARAAARGDPRPPTAPRWGHLLSAGALLGLAASPLVVGVAVLALLLAVLLALLSPPATTATVALLSPVAAGGYLALALAIALVGTGRIRAAYAGKRFLRVAATGTCAAGALGLCLLVVPVLAGLAIAAAAAAGPVGALAVLVLAVLAAAYLALASATLVGLCARRLGAVGALEPVTAEEPLELSV